jgi:hypothetical protein
MANGNIIYTDPVGRTDGVITSGTGSGAAMAPYVISPFEGLRQRGRQMYPKVYTAGYFDE